MTERPVDRLLRIIAQETFRLHNPDGHSSPWADEWRDEGMQAAAGRLVASYEAKTEPYRQVLDAWVQAHDLAIAEGVLREASEAAEREGVPADVVAWLGQWAENVGRRA